MKNSNDLAAYPAHRRERYTRGSSEVTRFSPVSRADPARAERAAARLRRRGNRCVLAAGIAAVTSSAGGCSADEAAQGGTAGTRRPPDAATSARSSRDGAPPDGRFDSGAPPHGHDAASAEAGRIEFEAGVDASRDSAVTDARAADARHDARVVIPPPFTAHFLWRPITFEGAVDLGHPAERVQADAQVGPGPVTLEIAGDAAGLGDAVGGGDPKGVGLAFVDVDGDGYDDLFIANGYWPTLPPAPLTVFPSKLYLNHRDGTFTDATEASGLKAILDGTDLFSVAVADYDADGDLDLYVTSIPKDILLQNDGRGHFTDVTAAGGAGGGIASAPVGRGGKSKIAAWGDLDGDGHLDVAVASSTFQGYTINGYLLHNKGDGTFEGVTASSGYHAAPTGDPCAILWTDYDNDGDQDLQIWNDEGTATANRVLLENDGHGHFTDVAPAAKLTDSIGHPMGIDGADIDRNGFLDYYVGNIGGNPLYLANGDGTFTNVMTAAGVAGNYGWGLGFEDLNADSWPDIFVSQLNDKQDLTFTHQGVVPPKFAGHFWATTPTLYTGWAHNVAAAFADYDKNGTVDVVRATTDGSKVTLFKNVTTLGSESYLEVRIGRAPRTGEKGGVSARVVVKTGDLVQFRDINGGSSRASTNATSARFGLGQWTGADWVAAIWPDGRELSALNVPGNRTLILSAP